MKSFFQWVLLSFLYLIPITAQADFEVINPNTKHYSDKYKIGTGSFKADSGTVYDYGFKSGSQLKVYVKTKSGQSFLQNAVFAVYEGSISTSNEVARTGNLKGQNSGSVLFTPRVGNYSYKAVLATESPDGTKVDFYINDPIVIREKVELPSVSSVSPSTGKVDQRQTYIVSGSNLPSTLAFTIADADDCGQRTHSSTRATFSCIPRANGNKEYIVKDRSGGTALKRGTINVSNADPVVSSVSPGTGKVDVAQTYTVNGSNFPSTLAFTIADADDCGQRSYSSTRATFSCIPRAAGNKDYIVKDRSGGTALKRGTIAVASADASVSSVSPSTGKVNVTQDYIVKGSNLPSTLVFTIADAGDGITNLDSCGKVTHSSSQVVFRCIPRVAGNKDYIVKDRSGGTALKRGTISIANADASVSSVSPLTGQVGITQDYTITGTNLPATLVFGFPENNANCTKKSLTSTKAVFTCGVEDDGNLKYVVRGKPGDASTDIKTGTISISVKDTSSAGRVTPNPGFVGDTFKFSVTLNDDLPSGYDVVLTLADANGDWTLINHVMTGGPRTFEYLREISSAGVDRQYRIAIFKGDTIKTAWHYGTYTAKEKVAIISDVSPLLGEVNKGQVYTITGQKLPSTLVFTIADAEDCGQRSYTSTSVSFHCIPRASGQKDYVVKDRSQGAALKRGTISVAEENSDSITAYLSQGEPVVAEILSASNIDKSLSRAEASILLDVFLSKQNPAYKKDMGAYSKPFADADNASDYYLSIKRLAYFKGKQDSETVLTKENNLLRPLDEVLRQEFVKMIVQGMDLQINRGTTHIRDFSDFNQIEGKWSEGYFNTAVAEGLIFGDAGYLKPIDALTIKEALLILARAKGKTEHDGNGFEAPEDFDAAQLFSKSIGFEYEPAYYLRDHQPIEITELTVSSPSSTDKSNCGVTDSNNFKVLSVTATTDSSDKVHEYYWWTTNFGYFRQYGSDEQFKKVCFFPATTQPFGSYQVTVNGGDNIGYVSRQSKELPSTIFTYGNGISVDIPGNQIAEIKYNASDSFMRAGDAFSLDLSATQIKKTGVDLGLEHVVLRLIVDGEKYEVFSGQPLSGIATFIVPDNSEFYGKDTQLEITLNTQQIKAVKNTGNIKVLPRFVVGGKVFNAGIDNNVSSVHVGGKEIALDENNEFYIELDSQSEVQGLPVYVVGDMEANAFDAELVDLTYTDPRAFIAFVGEDRRSPPDIADDDGDGIEDSLDNCPNTANPDQADLDADVIGDVCDDDRDGDNKLNDQDAFPDDKNEWLDTDSDGTGNNADTDDDGDGIPDTWEIQYGLDPLNAADALLDNDNDGVTNLDEYLQASNPNGSFTWDIDGDGVVKPLTDGLLNLRHLFGFTGDALINGAVDESATRKTSADIEAYLNESELPRDIDGDGEIKPLTDGLLLLRYTFGFSDDALTNGAMDTNATRTTFSEIESYISSYLPPKKNAYFYEMSDNSFGIGEQPYTVDSGMAGNKLWSYVQATDNGNITQYAVSQGFYIRSKVNSDIESLRVKVKVIQSGSGAGCASIHYRDEHNVYTTLFEICSESKELIVNMKSNFNYRAEVNAQAYSSGSGADYKNEMSFDVIE